MYLIQRYIILNTYRFNICKIHTPVYEHYTEYSKCLENTVKELVGEDVSESVIIEHSNDGSGIGAAVLAASQYLDA